MAKPIIVVDDDLNLVAEFRQRLALQAPNIPVVGPPDILLDLKGIGEKSTQARAIVLDLHIGGSGTYGQAILRKLSRRLEKFDIPVVIWSKYLADTILFEPGGVVRMVHNKRSHLSLEHLSDTETLTLQDWPRIMRLRKIYKGTRVFVTKIVPDPVAELFGVLQRSGVIPLEFISPSA